MIFHHIGIIVDNIQTSIFLYKKMGFTLFGEQIVDDVQRNNIAFLINPNSAEKIELIEPLDSSSTVSQLPKGYAHICYEVDNLDEFVTEFRKKDVGIIFTSKMRAPALGKREIIFAYLKNKTILEFIERG